MSGYNPTLIGRLLNSMVKKWAIIVSKYKWVYYVLAYTWGLPMTILGHIIEFILICCFRKKHFHYYFGRYYIMGKNWGGIEFGTIYIVNGNPSEYILTHELGHLIQNTLFGPFQLLIWLASACRYWVRELLHIDTPYDNIWFEWSATEAGITYAYEKGKVKSEFF